jgi:hypothetical protein
MTQFLLLAFSTDKSGCTNMAKKIEIFENEEATQFLDYYVSYMKFQNVIDNIKGIATHTGDASPIHEEPMEPHSGIIDELVDPHSTIAFPISLDK